MAYDPNMQQAPYPQAPQESSRTFTTTWLLAWLVGVFGVDRFYLGKIGTGVLKLVTFGGFGVWALIDLILVLTGSTRDKDGLPLSAQPANKLLYWILPIAIFIVGGISNVAQML